MDGKGCCNLMDKLSISADTQHIQLPRPFCADPLVMFHMYPETANQVACSEDLSFLPFMSEHFITENFCSDPCGFSYQIPHCSYNRSEYSYGPAFIRKRNERERQRVKCVNEGYAKLRHHLPKEYLEKRLSKVETLRAAIKYISLAGSCLCKNGSCRRIPAHGPQVLQHDAGSGQVPLLQCHPCYPPLLQELLRRASCLDHQAPCSPAVKLSSCWVCDLFFCMISNRIKQAGMCQVNT
uniref:Chromosome 11 open reading frame 16 n=1 Tax=Gallus gallus TaxID=9031 RepID=A0A8V0ZL60_CHICK